MARILGEEDPNRLRPVRKTGFQPRAQVEGTLTGEVGLRCQLTHRPKARVAWYRIEGRRHWCRRPSRFTCALRTRNHGVTRTGDSQYMRRLAIALTALSLGVTGTALAGGGGGGGGVPQIPRVPGQWAHVEINLKIRRAAHTVILDRGPVIQASATSITLRELGIPAVVPVDSNTLVVINGLPATTSDLKRKMNVVAMRIDGGPAVRVRATSF